MKIWVDRMRRVRIGLILAALIISVVSLFVSHLLVRDLEVEERSRMAVWAEAMRTLTEADDDANLSLVLKVLNGNNSIPVIVLDSDGEVLDFRNIDCELNSDSLAQLKMLAQAMERSGHSMKMGLKANASPEDYIKICYDESLMLKRLASYPWFQLGMVGLFILVAVYAILSSKRAEQNKVWVGLSRETAHQLGTPISSLMAWGQVLRETYPDDVLLPEMEKDIARLELIAERFSKIGSAPELVSCDVVQVVSRVVAYMGRRAPAAVSISLNCAGEIPLVRLNAPLFEWVIENLCKNAIDAMSGKGRITVEIFALKDRVAVDVSDTGKGIPRKNFKNVFKPGFTTKERGWGLGLSLAKRIVCEYHRGRIYVKKSQRNVGTTFTVELWP